jgi:hypothetical protein
MIFLAMFITGFAAFVGGTIAFFSGQDWALIPLLIGLIAALMGVREHRRAKH